MKDSLTVLPSNELWERITARQVWSPCHPLYWSLKWLQMWTVKLSKQASTFLSELDEKRGSQVENGLEELQKDPYTGKALKGELKGYWSLRVGMYRIIYSIQKKEVIIEVLRIHHRKEVYEKIRRL
jgi:mRNA interferase RelE/StbE